ncbi:MAG: hypothetical protein IT363_10895 [Methanoregulaceae archaeon]|nr:hypothetical protein [Methanoregulaceae archaeon]
MSDSERSVHDNLILSYEVSCAEKTIRFRTQFDADPPERTDVLFSGVVSYQFKLDSLTPSIIFDFEPHSPMDVYDGLAAHLPNTFPFGWPGPWATSRESARAYFEENRISAWYLSSSLGMRGWILAETKTVIPL